MTQFRMQARASDTNQMYFWTSADRDFDGTSYPGTGTAEEIAVLGENLITGSASAVFSVFSRTGNVTAQAGDYDATEVEYNATTVGAQLDTLTTGVDQMLVKNHYTFGASGATTDPSKGSMSIHVVDESGSGADFQLNIAAGHPVGTKLSIFSGCQPTYSTALNFSGGEFLIRNYSVSAKIGYTGSATIMKISATEWVSITGYGDFTSQSLRVVSVEYATETITALDPVEFSSVVSPGSDGYTVDLANGTITVDDQGTYAIRWGAKARSPSSDDNKFMELTLRINNSAVASVGANRIGTTVGTQFAMSESLITTLDPGDTIKLTPEDDTEYLGGLINRLTVLKVR